MGQQMQRLPGGRLPYDRAVRADRWKVMVLALAVNSTVRLDRKLHERRRVARGAQRWQLAVSRGTHEQSTHLADIPQ
jgi:hypothetical protein